MQYVFLSNESTIRAGDESWLSLGNRIYTWNVVSDEMVGRLVGDLKNVYGSGLIVRRPASPAVSKDLVAIQDHFEYKISFALSRIEALERAQAQAKSEFENGKVSLENIQQAVIDLCGEISKLWAHVDSITNKE